MAILFVGNEDISFKQLGSPTIQTNATFFREGYARCALESLHPSFWVVEFAAQNEFWFTARVCGEHLADASSRGSLWQLRSNSRAAIRMFALSGGNYEIHYWSDDDWQTVGETVDLASYFTSGIHQITVHVNYSDTGFIKVWLDSVQVMNFQSNLVGTSGYSALDSLVLSAVGRNDAAVYFPTYWSEVIVATEDCRTWNLVTIVPTANGSSTEWTGSSSDIDEVVHSSSDSIEAPSYETVASFATNNLPDSNDDIVAISLDAVGVSGPFGPRAVSLTFINEGEAVVQDELDADIVFDLIRGPTLSTNPTTGQPWTNEDINNLEIAAKGGSFEFDYTLSSTTTIDPVWTAASLTDSDFTWTRPDGTTFNGKAPATTEFTQIGNYRVSCSDWSAVTIFDSGTDLLAKADVKGLLSKTTSMQRLALATNTPLEVNLNNLIMPSAMTDFVVTNTRCFGDISTITFSPNITLFSVNITNIRYLSEGGALAAATSPATAFRFDNCSLPQEDVDRILADAVASNLIGDEAGAYLLHLGGTATRINAAPSQTGLNNVDILRQRNWTVTHS